MNGSNDALLGDDLEFFLLFLCYLYRQRHDLFLLLFLLYRLDLLDYGLLSHLLILLVDLGGGYLFLLLLLLSLAASSVMVPSQVAALQAVEGVIGVDDGGSIEALVAEIIVFAVVALVSDSNNVGVALIALGGVSEWCGLLIFWLLRSVASEASMESSGAKLGLLHDGEGVCGVLDGGLSNAVVAEVIVGAIVTLVTESHNVGVAGVTDGWVMEGGLFVVLGAGMDDSTDKWTALLLLLLLSFMAVVVSMTSSVTVRASPSSKGAEMGMTKGWADDKFQDFVLVDAKCLTQLSIGRDIDEFDFISVAQGLTLGEG